MIAKEMINPELIGGQSITQGAIVATFLISNIQKDDSNLHFVIVCKSYTSLGKKNWIEISNNFSVKIWKITSYYYIMNNIIENVKKHTIRLQDSYKGTSKLCG